MTGAQDARARLWARGRTPGAWHHRPSAAGLPHAPSSPRRRGPMDVACREWCRTRSAAQGLPDRHATPRPVVPAKAGTHGRRFPGIVPRPISGAGPSRPPCHPTPRRPREGGDPWTSPSRSRADRGHGRGHSRTAASSLAAGCAQATRAGRGLGRRASDEVGGVEQADIHATPCPAQASGERFTRRRACGGKAPDPAPTRRPGA
jgi:hypothetical protein